MKFFVLFLLIENSAALAQTITCRPHGQSNIVSLVISRPDFNFDVPWYMAKLTNKYRQVQNFVVEPTSRKDKLLFVTKSDRDEFVLNFGSYKGLGMYHGTQLDIHKGHFNELSSNMMCNINEDLEFKNICDVSKESHPQDIFFQASRSRNLDLMESALSCEIDAEARNKEGCTALLLVADPFCGQKMGSPLSYNSIRNSFKLVDLLTNNGATLEAADPISGERALHKFTKNKDLESVDLLLDLEADVNAQDLDGSTAIMKAVENNDKHMVLRILEANPDLKVKNKKGQTALDIAKLLNYKKLEAYLEKPALTVEVHGMDDGTCHTGGIKIPLGRVSQFILKATEKRMFLMVAPDLGLNIMAHERGTASQNIIPKKQGEFEFSCGIHGGTTQTTGKIFVE